MLRGCSWSGSSPLFFTPSTTPLHWPKAPYLGTAPFRELRALVRRRRWHRRTSTSGSRADLLGTDHHNGQGRARDGTDRRESGGHGFGESNRGPKRPRNHVIGRFAVASGGYLRSDTGADTVGRRLWRSCRKEEAAWLFNAPLRAVRGARASLRGSQDQRDPGTTALSCGGVALWSSF